MLVERPLDVLALLLLIVLGKPINALLLILLLRYPVGLALGIASGIAQIGEFSFILAGLGATYGLVSKEGQSLILAAALLSIALNPLAFAAAEIIGKRVAARFPASPPTGAGRGSTRSTSSSTVSGRKPKSANSSRRARSPNSSRPSRSLQQSTPKHRRNCFCSSSPRWPRPANASCASAKGGRDVFRRVRGG